MAGRLHFTLGNGDQKVLTIREDRDHTEELELFASGGATRYIGKWIRVDGDEVIAVATIVSVRSSEP
jgi:hypothetical protein